MYRQVILLLLLFAGISRAESDELSWPQFRGPNGSGVSDSADIPDEWSNEKNHAWSVIIPGSGYSSPIVVGNRIFLTSAIPDKEEDKAPRGMRAESTKYVVGDTTYDWRVHCISLEDGSVLWQKSVHVGKPKKGKHPKNSYATETPVSDGKCVYFYFSQVGLFAFSLDGMPLWKADPGTYETYLEYGTSSSPVTDGKRIYLQADNEEQAYVAAFDVNSGKEVWRTNRDEITSWSTPFLWKNSLRDELVTVAPRKARAYDPTTGKLLWELGGMSKLTVPVPVADDNYCYISCGQLVDAKNRPIYSIRPGASGDISLPKGSHQNSYVHWHNPLGAPYVPSPLIYKGNLYVVHDRPLFDCLSLETGKQIYPRSRLPKGGNFTASPVASRDKIIILSEEGLAYVLDAGDKFHIRQINPPLDDDGLFLATPAIAGRSLLLRGAKTLHCVREGAK
ncbi:PQQ-like beta-propeller repeat protein [bacterium]|nr:PQQ-like beta-propeller repeat protein [bacterium]